MAWFDYGEGIFWWLLACFVLVGRPFREAPDRAKWSRRLSVVLVPFGASDIIQRGGPWWSPWWLLTWKAACVVGLAIILYRLRCVWKPRV